MVASEADAGTMLKALAPHLKYPDGSETEVAKRRAAEQLLCILYTLVRSCSGCSYACFV